MFHFPTGVVRGVRFDLEGGWPVATAKSIQLAALGALPILVLACSGGPRAKSSAAVAEPTPAEAVAVVADPVPAAGETTPAPSAVEPAPVEMQPGEHQPDEIEAADAAEEEPMPEGASPSAAELLHASLDHFEAARTSWEHGDLEGAFASLDQAYAAMAGVAPNGDPLLVQEKENLRQLISRRVVEIYASRQVGVGNRNGSIPLVVNDDVQREIASFQGRERSFFLESYARSGLYRPMILAKLAEVGLPEQLSWLPLVESGFKERALSSARAVGLWQFIASTGYRYGLDRSDWIDERMDPEKSTGAAIAYLTDLHALTGDWLTALAAYNCGEGNVLRQIGYQKEGYFDQFWDLYTRLPFETRRYVPRFLATLAILEDPARYGFTLPTPYEPVAVEKIQVARATRLESLDAALGLEKGTLARLNPELRKNGTPKSAYELSVPAGRGPELLASIASVPEWTPPKVETATHRVRSGETLGQIAARYRTSVKTLMSMNRLRSANRLSVGQVLRVPSRGGSSSTGSSSEERVARATPKAVAPEAAASESALVQHRVRSGESLWILASRYGTSPEQIRADNGLTSNLLQVGQVLRIRSSRDRVGG
jgi:membrane-bound lytic murein transglycosylase D